MKLEFILASASPRRLELLQNLGLDFKVVVPDADESSSLTEPCALTEELALLKGRTVADRLQNNNAVIISCDTVVHVDGKILGKPKDADDARAMLGMLSGRTHEVVSGICVIYGGKAVTAHEVTSVTFAALSDAEIERCILLDPPYDKAGSYAIQGIASLFIEKLDGDYFNVVGLPIHKLGKILLDRFGIALCDHLKPRIH